MKNNNHSVIKFNKNIYSEKAIVSSIAAFKHLAHFDIQQKGDYYLVILSKINPQVKDVIKDEFNNYVLAKIKTD